MDSAGGKPSNPDYFMLLTLTLTLAPTLVSAPSCPTPEAPAASGTGEVVELIAEDKVVLAATFFAPRDEKGRSPAAVLIHGADADRSQLEKVGSYLQKKGFGVIALDLRGHGASTASCTPWDDQDLGTREKSWAFAMRDLKAATNFLRQRSDIHTSNLTMVGFGAGYNLAAQQGVRDENVRAVVLVNPAGNEFGFNLLADMEDMAGLPTLLVVSKDERKGAERMQTAVHSTAGEAFVDISVLKSKTERLLSDRSLNSKLSGWLKDTVMPKRSR